MLSRNWVVALAVTLMISTAGVADAATIVVRPNTDTDTIQKAVDAAQDGDTIVLPRGVYDESVFVNTPNLKFVGKRAIWESSTHDDCLEVDSDGISITGIIFRHGNANVRVLGDFFTATRCVFLRANDDSNVIVEGDDAVIDRCRLIGNYRNGIDVLGNRAMITRNYVALTDNRGIRGEGTHALVERNVIQSVQEDHGVEWIGDNCDFVGNRISNMHGHCLDLTGNSLVVDRNVVTASGELILRGGDFAITRNRFLRMGSSSEGIKVDMGMSTGGIIERNVIFDACWEGIHLSGSEVEIFRNLIRRCGTDGESGMFLDGDDNNIEGNRIFDCYGHGIEFDEAAGGNNLIGNLVRGCLIDGFHVQGNMNSLTGNRALGNHGEGLDNGGTNTTCENNVFSGNRLDVGNDGTFASFTGNRVRTGGETTPSEID